MRYIGGKSRIAKEIVDAIIDTHTQPMQYIGGKTRIAKEIVAAIRTDGRTDGRSGNLSAEVYRSLTPSPAPGLSQ